MPGLKSGAVTMGVVAPSGEIRKMFWIVCGGPQVEGCRQLGAAIEAYMATIELVPADSATLLRYTEHTAFVDGNDASEGRREGSLGLLEALAKELGGHD